MDAPQPRPHPASDGRNRRRWGAPGWIVLAGLLVVAGAVTGTAEDEEVDYSPGALSEAHAFMDDPDSCENCHNDDLEVEGDRCLICHDAIGTRMEQKKGLHRDVTVDDCAMCHAEHGGRDAEMLPLDRSDFDHAAETGFALVGAHARAAADDCSNCHEGRSFLTLEPECTSCHENVHQGTLGDDCTRCHTPEKPFRNASRAFHQSALLPLEGRHLDVDCAECHWNGVIEGTPTRCYDCHWIRRQDDPFRTQLGVECEDCHRPISWTAVSWDHAVATGYEIGAVHRTVDCEGCHAGRRFDGPVVPDCQSCHLQDYQGTRDPDHVAAGFPTECSLCHRPSDPSWNFGTFEHPYPLVGTHRTVSCAGCHADGIYQGTPTECVDCHIDDYRSTVDPDHETGGFPTTCELCHTPTSWNNATFDHSTFERVGVHATLPCASCHPSGVYEGTPRDCVGCHLADYQGSQSPDHAAAGFPTDCETCHRPSDPSWQEATYPHSVFPLVASHALQPCSACHSSGVYLGLPSECVDCHLEDYNATQDPDHAAAGFPTACEVCHEPTAWGDADFAHTFYPLVGVHATQACSACHSSGVYAGLPSDCVDCHQADYDASVNPDHAAAGFPTACDACHSNADPSWQEATYPHSVFPLVASHALQPCSACHSSGVYLGLPSECVDCHLEDYNATQDPNHAESGFPTTCEACHEPTAWGDADFAHTFYPLVGVHATQACSACHSSGVYAGLPSDCVDCHQADYDASVNPDHAAAGFPTACDACHSNADPSWQAATYPHSVFPLVATHALQPCSACHSSGVYAGLPSECVDCHLADYNATQDPNHAESGFPTTCDACHEPTSWNDADFAHTTYALVGVHATLDCQACHSSGVYAGLPSACVDCHQADYDASVNPDHAAAGFPTTCDACHSNADPSWQEATYPHTVFPLVATHALQPCSACHSSGVYAGLQSECVDCHLADYNATQDPNHSESGFPTTCEACHEPTTWGDADFAHTTYALVGVHATLDCQACHSSGVYAGLPSACVDCHQADYDASVNPDHAAAGFPTTCDACHSNADASWQEATYPHTVFPLVATHALQPCTACHSSGVYAGLPSACVDCHLADYNATTDPAHASAGFPTTCEACHEPTTWQDATFDHTGFPLVGAHATQPCTACHSSGIYEGLPSDCVDCHQADYDASADPDHAAAGFPTTCDACHSAAHLTWDEAVYGHTAWPLLGLHADQTCVTCHASGVYAGLPSDCVDCHLDDYNATTNPDHAAVGYPTYCDICHRPSDLSWNQGTFDHFYFPITSGPHGNRDCEVCHISMPNMAVFSCLSGGCHPQAKTEDIHSGEAGFVYDSPACYACHPDGRPPGIVSSHRRAWTRASH